MSERGWEARDGGNSRLPPREHGAGWQTDSAAG